MAAKSAQPCFSLPVIRPNVFVSANGISRMRNISSQFVSPFGFSNGWAELALKGPPPLLPSSLIASCDANGPTVMVWLAPWSVCTVVEALNVWTTPWETSTSAATKAIGSRM